MVSEFGKDSNPKKEIYLLLNVYVTYKYIEDIQMFGVNMTFISSSEVKKCIFHECRRSENISFIFSLVKI